MVGAVFEFQGVLTVGFVLGLLGCVGVLAWFFSRFATRKEVTRTIARQIWNPERPECLCLFLGTEVEIGPSGYGDGDFTFDCPRGATPVALRFRGAKVSFCPQCVVDVDGDRKKTEWRTGGESGDRFHDLVLDGVACGDRVVCTFSWLEISEKHPYINPHFVIVTIVPPV